MTHTACELMWIKSLLSIMSIIYKSIVIYCDNQTVMYIVNNPVFHKRMKHIDGDAHRIVVLFVTLSCQFGDIFTKILSRKSFSILCSKVGMIDIYAPA